MLFSETVDEILGYFAPGGFPTIKHKDLFPAQATFVHENCHRKLINTTSLGIFMRALGLATVHAKSESQREASRSFLTELINLSWFVHEGLATQTQLSLFESSNHGKAQGSLKSQLPLAYKLAAEKFDVSHLELDWREVANKAEKLTNIGARPTDKSEYVRQHIAQLMYVVAHAAKSIPLETVINSDTDPLSYTVLTQVRKNSPDVRLQLLMNALSDSFFTEVCVETMHGLNLAWEQDRMRPLDDATRSLSKSLCKEAGLEYEASDLFDEFSLFMRLEVDPHQIKLIDARDLPIAAVNQYDSETALIPHSFVQPQFIELQNSADYYRQYAEWYGEDLDAYCEVIKIEKDTVFLFSLFSSLASTIESVKKIDSEVASTLENSSVPELYTSKPCLHGRFLCAYEIMIGHEKEFFSKLLKIFSFRSIVWICPLEAAATKFDLQQLGELITIPTEHHTRSRLQQKDVVKVIDPMVFDDGIGLRGAEKETLALTPLPVGILYREYESQKLSNDTVAAVTYGTPYEHDEVDIGTYRQNCAAHAIYFGVTNMMRRG